MTNKHTQRARWLSLLDTDFLVSIFHKVGGRNTEEGRAIYHALKLQAKEGRHAYAK